MKLLAFDLETIADRAMLPLLPEVKPNGNLKDPAKIADDIAEKKKKQIAGMGLDPMTSMICCAGWFDENGPGHIMLEEESPAAEKDLLERWWEVAAKYDHFASFNGRPFDMRHLLLHGMAHGVRPSVTIDHGRYNRGNHIDLRLVLAGENQFASGKLGFFAQKFLGEQKTEGIDGELIQGMWDMELYEDIGLYCEDDCRLVYDLFYKAETAGLLE